MYKPLESVKMTQKRSGEPLVRDIKRKTRRKFTNEEKYNEKKRKLYALLKSKIWLNFIQNYFTLV